MNMFVKYAGFLVALGLYPPASAAVPEGRDIEGRQECSSLSCEVTKVAQDTPQDTSTAPDTVVPSIIHVASLRYGMDTTISPCDDLYNFANGGWRRDAVLPPNKKHGMQMVTVFDHVSRSMQRRLTSMLDSVRKQSPITDNHTLRVLAEFYTSCMNADTLESPLFPRRKSDPPVPDSTREQQCTNRVRAHMGAAAGQYFAQELNRTHAVERMERLLELLKSEIRQMLLENSIMNAEEKQYAVDRLDRLVLRVGIPKTMVDYEPLVLDSNDYYGNKKQLLNFFNTQWVDAIGGNIREQWKASLLRPNAMYMPGDHAIEIPTLMFSPPFFYVDGEELLNYAGIGYVIGHEIFHSVAPQLHHIQDDRMQQELNAFMAFNTSMGELDGWIANGKRTFNEDVADLGGGRVAYRAWKRAIQGKEDSTLREGLTPDQRFFVAIGRIWRSKWRGGAPNSDVHAPYFARVNATVMQMPAFAQAFGCTEGDPMYLAPAQQSKIW